MAIAERDEAIADRAALLVQLRGPELVARFLQSRHRRPERIAGSTAVTKISPADDLNLIARIVAAYRAANDTALGSNDSYWLQSFSDFKRPVHDALMSRNAEAAVAPMLRDPASNMLFYGFDNLTSSTNPPASTWGDPHHLPMYDDLLRLAEAIGALPLENPETPYSDLAPDTEVILRTLDAAFGFTVKFPNPYPREIGLATSRGVASYRAVQALYQASRVAELAPDPSTAKVVEIGGGLGRTPYCAYQFGLRDYTLIDLPMTNVAQAYFLGRVLGPDAISLFGESRRGIQILPPAGFLEATDHYHIALNVDSLPEMAPETAIDYCKKMISRADVFLSINHEFNAQTVRGIYADLKLRAVSRTPYWLRRGYVEEVFKLSAQR
jgi:hypothetical protein